MSQPLASIVCATYNHEDYIEQALKSFVSQKTDFPFEVVVGDDGSSDNTTDICQRYAEMYPGIIRHMLRNREVSVAYGFPGKYNGINSYRDCRGKYISICDGDDFFASPDTLQRQVDFLEANPNYGMVHGGANYLFQDSGRLSAYQVGTADLIPSGFVYNEIFVHNFVKTCTACIRREYALEYAEISSTPGIDIIIGDCFMWMLVSFSSKVGYIDAPLATYRIHSKSLTNLGNNMKYELSWAHEKFWLRHYFKEHFGCPYSDEEILLFYLRRAVKIAESHGNNARATRYMKKYQQKLNRWLEKKFDFMMDVDVAWM